jgi:hypothetical protein
LRGALDVRLAPVAVLKARRPPGLALLKGRGWGRPSMVVKVTRGSVHPPGLGKGACGKG